MDCADMICHQTCLCQIRRTLEPDCKTMQTRPPCTAAVIILDSVLGISLCNCRYYAGIQAAGEEYTVGHIAHKLPFNCTAECLANIFAASRIILDSVKLHPVALVISSHFPLAAPIVMTRQERLETLALPFQGFKFRSDIHFTVRVITDVQRYHANRVACNQETVSDAVVQGKCIDAAERLQHLCYAFVGNLTFICHLLVECKYHLAVATGKKTVFPGKAPADILMIVNLSVDSQHQCLVWREEGLTAALRVDNTQAFMSQNRASSAPYSAPVGSAVPDTAAHLQSLLTQRV